MPRERLQRGRMLLGDAAPGVRSDLSARHGRRKRHSVTRSRRGTMEKRTIWLSALMLVASGGLVAFTTAPSVAQSKRRAVTQTAQTPQTAITAPKMWSAVADLKTGDTRIFTPQITRVFSPSDTNGDGFLEGVLKVNLDPQFGYTKMEIVLDYEGTPTGYTFNLGDSATNNGGGGDSGTQTRDAELEIICPPVGNPAQLSVYSSDVGTTLFNATRLAHTRIGLYDTSLKIVVSDMFVSWGHPYAMLDFTRCPDGADLLFALDDQEDFEGPRNYDLFVGMNMVVSGYPGRIGSGLARVYIRLE
jgi:hypothetical protein